MFWKKKRRKITNAKLPLTRFIGPVVTIIGLLSVLGFGFGKGIDLSLLDSAESETATELDLPPEGTLVAGHGKFVDRIRIASFNIKVFGDKKSSDPNVMAVLTNIMSRFDLIAIQEVRSPESSPVERLVNAINASGGQYACTVSPPVGRSRSNQTEQYAFVWDATRIRAVPDSSYVVSDPEDRMHREPMATTFEAIAPVASGRHGFKFTLINVHTDPDEVLTSSADNELNVLDDVYLSIREYEYARRGEDDIILLGDLNVDRAHLYELGAIRGLTSVVGDYPTNTVGTEVYDHILVDTLTTTEFTGAVGVIDFVRDLGLTEAHAPLVSDHRPIWAEFSIYEAPAHNAIATRPSVTPTR